MEEKIDFDAMKAIIFASRNIVTFPWENHSEDRWAAQEAITTLYASLQLPKPRMAWAPSPATMHRASRMLRNVQAGQAYNMVQALVPQDGNRIEREAKVALLAAMIDPDVTTQSGGLLISMIEGVFGRQGAFYPALSDLKRRLRFTEDDPSKTWAPAMFSEQCMYPAMYPGFDVPRLRHLRQQAFAIMPFAKLCWICRPPLYIRTDEVGRLHAVDAPAAAWSDGFEVYCDLTPKEPRLEVHAETKALPAPEAGE